MAGLGKVRAKKVVHPDAAVVTTKVHEPIHPGEILLGDFLEPLGISQYRIAQAIGVSPRRINEIVQGQRRITPETAVRLSKALGLTPRYRINMQAYYNLEMELDRASAELEAIPQLVVA